MFFSIYYPIILISAIFLLILIQNLGKKLVYPVYTNINSIKIHTIAIIVFIVTIFITLVLLFLFDTRIYTLASQIHLSEELIYRFTFLWTNNSNIFFLWLFLGLYFVVNISNSFYIKNRSGLHLNYFIWAIYICFFIFIAFIYQEHNYIVENAIHMHNGLYINPNLRDLLLLIHPPIILSFYFLISIYFVIILINFKYLVNFKTFIFDYLTNINIILLIGLFLGSI